MPGKQLCMFHNGGNIPIYNFKQQSHQLHESVAMHWGNHVLWVSIIIIQTTVSSHIATNAALWWKMLIMGKMLSSSGTLKKHTASLILKLLCFQRETKWFASWQSSITNVCKTNFNLPLIWTHDNSTWVYGATDTSRPTGILIVSCSFFFFFIKELLYSLCVQNSWTNFFWALVDSSWKS